MRESNNVILDEIKSGTNIIGSNSEYIPTKSETEIDTNEENLLEIKDNVNLDTGLENKDFLRESEKIVNSNLFKKDSLGSYVNNDRTIHKKTLNSLVNDNEAQFRMIATKFNEAVEVILELSNKVKKLEETVYDLSVKPIKNKKKHSFFGLKSFVLIIVIIVIISSVYTFPIDWSLIKLIITDIISSI